MVNNDRVWARVLAAMAVLALGAAAGCGTGEYERRMQQSIQSGFATGGGGGAGGGGGGGGVEVPGTSITLAVPSAYQLLAEGTDPSRLTPPFDLPDRKATYEASIADATQGKQHYYLYVATADAAADPLAALVAQLGQKGLSAGSIEDSSVPIPGGDGNWKKVRATGQQEFFYLDASGQGQPTAMDGIVEAWGGVHKPSNSYVLLVWRVPAVLAGADYANLDGVPKATAASVGAKP